VIISENRVPLFRIMLYGAGHEPSAHQQPAGAQRPRAAPKL
jgi:hypothetical protein